MVPGRSNRDNDFILNTYKNTEYQVKIISEGIMSNYNNIKCYNNIFDNDYYKMLSNFYFVLISLKDENISADSWLCFKQCNLKSLLSVQNQKQLQTIYKITIMV